MAGASYRIPFSLALALSRSLSPPLFLCVYTQFTLYLCFSSVTICVCYNQSVVWTHCDQPQLFTKENLTKWSNDLLMIMHRASMPKTWNRYAFGFALACIHEMDHAPEDIRATKYTISNNDQFQFRIFPGTLIRTVSFHVKFNAFSIIVTNWIHVTASISRYFFSIFGPCVNVYFVVVVVAFISARYFFNAVFNVPPGFVHTWCTIRHQQKKFWFIEAISMLVFRAIRFIRSFVFQLPLFCEFASTSQPAKILSCAQRGGT